MLADPLFVKTPSLPEDGRAAFFFVCANIVISKSSANKKRATGGARFF
jgi:hypothetical protein